jgi:hypothetical protein
MSRRFFLYFIRTISPAFSWAVFLGFASQHTHFLCSTFEIFWIIQWKYFISSLKSSSTSSSLRGIDGEACSDFTFSFLLLQSLQRSSLPFDLYCRNCFDVLSPAILSIWFIQFSVYSSVLFFY